MSLRKSTCLTPRRVDAARRNSERSTGPRSEAGKERVKMNALKHGCNAAPENEAAVMRALGEDPERYAALKRELATAYGPGDALWDRQIEDLAKLYWRRNRIERMETGLMRRALQAVEERQRTRREQIVAATFDASNFAATDLAVGEPTERCVQLRLLLSRLGVIREQAGRWVFTPGQPRVLKTYQPGAIGWRPARLRWLLWLFIDRAEYQAKNDEQGLRDYENKCMGGAAGVEALHQELVRLLQEEIAAVEAAFGEEVKAQEEKDGIERDTCLAPAGETWEMLARQEMALDRSIDRKVKIILAMRKEHAQQCRGGSRTARTGTPWRAPTQETGPPDNVSNDQEAQELSNVVGLDPAAEVAPTFRACPERSEGSAGAGLKASPTNPGSESPEEENAGETSKSPEQSENVAENKGPAAERVCA
jgi:hypothetical protein